MTKRRHKIRRPIAQLSPWKAYLWVRKHGGSTRDMYKLQNGSKVR
jgi:hypothetical protein